MRQATWFAVSVLTATTVACGGGSDSPPSSGGPTPPPVSNGPTTVAITVASADSLFSLRDTVRYAATARDASGAAVSSAISWSSSDPSVATVVVASGPTTSVVAQGNGAATVTATSGALSATRLLVVAQRPVALAITPAAPDSMFAIGDSRTLNAVVRDAGGSSLAGAAIQWSVDRTSIATLSATSGATISATAVSNGTAIVAAKSGAFSQSAAIAIRQKLGQLAVSPTSLTLAAGASATIIASPKDARGNAIAGLDAPKFVSSDVTKATVSAAGVVTALGAGTATITVSQASVDGVVSASVPVTVGSAGFPTSASVDLLDDRFSPTTTDIAAGGTVTWTWKGFAAHDVTGTAAGSAIHGPLQTFGSYALTFSTPGTFNYVCTQHQSIGMAGTVTVH